jgi:hypothetical protein
VIYGAMVFTFERSAVLPRLVAVKGESEANWERKRAIWHGDSQRDKPGGPKKRKTKHGSGNDDDEDGVVLPDTRQASVGSGDTNA